MPTAQRELLAIQVPAPQRREACRAQLGESIHQALERPVGEAARLRESVERLERLRLPLGEDDLRPRNPVGLFAVNQVSHYVLGTPRVGALVPDRPRGGEPVEQALERTGGAGQDCEG